MPSEIPVSHEYETNESKIKWAWLMLIISKTLSF